MFNWPIIHARALFFCRRHCHRSTVSPPFFFGPGHWDEMTKSWRPVQNLSTLATPSHNSGGGARSEGGLGSFDFCLGTSIPVLTTSTHVAAWPQGDQLLGGGPWHKAMILPATHWLSLPFYIPEGALRLNSQYPEPKGIPLNSRFWPNFSTLLLPVFSLAPRHL